MLKRIISCIVVLSIALTLLMPIGIASASGRIEYSFTQATEYKGTKDQNMNVYGSFMYMGTKAGAKFSVFIPEAGRYNIVARLGCNSESIFTASVNNEPVEPVTANTGSNTTYQEVILNTVDMRAGYSTVMIDCTSGGCQFTHLYLDPVTASSKKELDFTKKEGTFKNHWLPCIIEAEDFDMGASYSAKGDAVKKQSYRRDSSLEIKEDGLATVVALLSNDAVTYTVNVDESKVYDILATSTTSGNIRIYFDDNKGFVEANLAALEESSLGSIYLTKGVHTIKVESVSEAINLDKIRFKTASNIENYINPSDLKEGTQIVIEKKEEVKTDNPVWKELYVSANGSDKGNGSEKSPFATIEAAKEAVRKLTPNMKGDIIVNILPGTYPITKPIDFTTEDSGKNGYNIIYKGTDPENKPLLTGGKKIDGWQKHNDKIWKAKVSDDIEMVRQMYINEFPARIARSKYQYRGTRAWDDNMTEFDQDGFYVPKKNFPVLTNTDDAEVIFQMMWELNYFPLKEIEDAGSEWLVKYDQPYFGRYLVGSADHSTPTAGIAVWLSNAPELMDEPGEFWYDKDEKTVYYYAFPEEDMETAEVYTPVTYGLMTATGKSKTEKVENIAFDNLDIRHGSWNEVATGGLFVGQGDIRIDPTLDNPQAQETWQQGRMFAQIEMNFADNISVTNCVFANHGSSVLAMRNCVTNSRIDGNIFRDIAGSAVVIGDIKYTDGVHTVEDISRNISVKNNVIRRVGHDYMGSIGIMILYANSIDAMHNDIRYVPYTGISIGWGWGSAISNTLRSGEHMIANNRIDRNGQAVYDGGAIYTLSSMKGMYIQGNYMSNSLDSGGIYFDQGSQNIVARDNVFENNQKNTLYSGKLIWDVYRNYANHLDSGSSSPWYNGTAEKIAMVKERPIRSEGDNWSPEARAIMANAGLQNEYKYLLNDDKVDYPEWRTMAIQLLSKDVFKSKTEVEVYASDWIPGGEGVAFHEINDVEPEDYGRKNSFVGNTYQGEWIKYNLPVDMAGNYNINIKYSLAFSGTEANASSETGVTLYIDGVKVSDEVGLESTGSWNSYVEKYIGTVNLTEGDHELMVLFSKGAFALEKTQAVHAELTGSDADYDDGVILTISKEGEAK